MKWSSPQRISALRHKLFLPLLHHYTAPLMSHVTQRAREFELWEGKKWAPFVPIVVWFCSILAVFYFWHITNVGIGQAVKDPSVGSFAVEEKKDIFVGHIWRSCSTVTQSVFECSLRRMRPLNWDTAGGSLQEDVMQQSAKQNPPLFFWCCRLQILNWNIIFEWHFSVWTLICWYVAFVLFSINWVFFFFLNHHILLVHLFYTAPQQKIFQGTITWPSWTFEKWFGAKPSSGCCFFLNALS